MLSDAYDEGFKSYRVNKGKLINPYKPNSNEFDEFERGWVQAQKRSSGGFMFLEFDSEADNARHTMAERYRDHWKVPHERSKPYRYKKK